MGEVMSEEGDKSEKEPDNSEDQFTETDPDEKEFEEKEKEIGKFEELLEKKEERIQELESLVKRVKADFENYKKRRKKEEDQIRNRARQDLMKRFMDPFDGLRSVVDLDISGDSDNNIEDLEREELKSIMKGLYEGIENVLGQFETILHEEGIEVIDPCGDDFNPEIHEAIGVQETEEGENNKISEVLQVGYKSKERVIRPARVIVYKNKSEPEREKE